MNMIAQQPEAFLNFMMIKQINLIIKFPNQLIS